MQFMAHVHMKQNTSCFTCFFPTTKIIDSRSTPPTCRKFKAHLLRISNQPCKFKLISLLLLLSLQSYSLWTTNYISNIPIYFRFTTSFVGRRSQLFITFFGHSPIHGGFLKWGIPKSPWVFQYFQYYINHGHFMTTG